MIAVVVSAANGCLYCLVAHGAALRAELGDRCSASGSLRLAPRRPRSAPARRSAPTREADPRAARVDAADLGRLREVGLTAAEAWDVIEISAMYNFHQPPRMGTTCCRTRSTRARPAGLRDPPLAPRMDRRRRRRHGRARASPAAAAPVSDGEARGYRPRCGWPGSETADVALTWPPSVTKTFVARALGRGPPWPRRQPAARAPVAAAAPRRPGGPLLGSPASTDWA